MPPDSQPGNSTPDKPLAPVRPASAADIRVLGIGLIFLSLLLAYLFISLWVSDLSTTTSGNVESVVTWFGTNWTFKAKVDERLLLLIMVTGALGSFVHTATSFSDFVGNEKLSTNWVWWYILRPFIGMALATIFYVAIRAGFLSGGGQPNTINLFGLTAVAGMVGMFSKQATDKLSEVFNTLFKTSPGGGDDERKDGLDGSASVNKNIGPAAPAPGAAPTTDTAITARPIDADSADGCAIPVTNPTPDDALPAARGGVG